MPCATTTLDCLGNVLRPPNTLRDCFVVLVTSTIHSHSLSGHLVQSMSRKVVVLMVSRCSRGDVPVLEAGHSQLCLLEWGPCGLGIFLEPFGSKSCSVFRGLFCCREVVAVIVRGLRAQDYFVGDGMDVECVADRRSDADEGLQGAANVSVIFSRALCSRWSSLKFDSRQDMDWEHGHITIISARAAQLCKHICAQVFHLIFCPSFYFRLSV